jgi:hypothetical protein
MGVTGMRRPLLALAVAALLTSPAVGQITPFPPGPTGQSNLALIAPTPASPTESSNRIATTRWVNDFVGAGLPLASGKVWIGSVGNIATPQTPSGDLTVSNAGVFTFGTVNANVGSFGSVTQCASVTVNAKGLVTAASQNVCTPAIASVTGLGTGVATALAVNVGSAGAFVTFNGALGTPASGNLANTSNLPVSGLAGMSAGMATWLAAASSANLRATVTDETGTGLLYFQGGDIGTPSAGVATNLTALNATQLTTGTIPTARLGLGQLTNSLGANVALNNVSNYFDGPSVAQGSTGTWFASGTVTATDTAGIANIQCKLWDGTTVIASAQGSVAAVNLNVAFALSGFIASPVGNIRISCKDPASTSGVMVFNGTGNSKDSTISVFRIN